MVVLRKSYCAILISCALIGIVCGDEKPKKATNYDHYTKIQDKTDTIKIGLRSHAYGWTLNRRPIKILSGSIHYFRIHPDCWRDRLRKLRAAGANTVDTTIPWNLHMFERGHTDFGSGFSVLGKKVNTTMTRFLDVVKFIETARQEDLFVIIRVGPYVGADLDLGGIPGWFLLVSGVRPRSQEKEFTTRLRNYYNELLPLLMPYGFSGNGDVSHEEYKDDGNIIAYQIDHELASTNAQPDEYIESMIRMLRAADIHEMVFLADLPSSPGTDTIGAVITQASNMNDRRVLRTASFAWNADVVAELTKLRNSQPDTQPMVSEFRTGRFDRWMYQHSTVPKATYAANLARVLDFPASVNVYMFSGGTNWGFISGASAVDTYPYYQTVATSYDNDAPLNEAGEFTPNYYAVKELFEKHSVTKIPWSLPKPPAPVNTTLPPAPVSGQLDLDAIVAQSNNWWKRDPQDNVTNMENIARAMNKRQLFGFALYRKEDVEFAAESVLKIQGRVHDVAIVMVDGKAVTEPLTVPEQLKGFGYWNAVDAELPIKSEVPGKKKLDILVENFGRMSLKTSDVDFYQQKKGLYDGPVLVDGNLLQKWEIIPLDLIDEDWMKSLSDWKTPGEHVAPAMYKATFAAEGRRDTFVDMRKWGRGVLFINGFNLGRYHFMGPTRTLYLPGPFLVEGENTIVVFEMDKRSDQIEFSGRHIRTAAPFSNPVDPTFPDKGEGLAATPATSCYGTLGISVLASFYWLAY